VTVTDRKKKRKRDRGTEKLHHGDLNVGLRLNPSLDQRSKMEKSKVKKGTQKRHKCRTVGKEVNEILRMMTTDAAKIIFPLCYPAKLKNKRIP